MIPAPAPAALLVLVGSYLVGAVPFGYLIGLARGVNLFRVGSGNIGATNVARTLGPAYGVLCFALDFLKGAGPVLAAVPVADALHPDAASVVGGPDALRAGAAALAFLGHLFPVYLGFRGGKGVATGAGTVAALVPGPTAVAALAWVTVALASRYVSLASVAAALTLSVARLVGTPDPFAGPAQVVTVYVLVGSVAVAVKHRANVHRLLTHTENRIGDRPMRHTLLRILHLLAVGLWFGGAAFFNFGTAVPVFDSFKRVVNDGPSDRTAYQTIIPPDAPDDRKAALASALAGSAVGPVFPRYFAMQAVCGGVALVTALAWWHAGGRVHRRRVAVIGVAVLLVAVGWPLSTYVSELRVERFSPDEAKAREATEAFRSVHLVSLLLSTVTTALAGVALALGAKLPEASGPHPAPGQVPSGGTRL